MKIVVFDLDETLGYFTEFGIFWDCLKTYLKQKNPTVHLTQQDFNALLSLFPQFLRPNIINILKFLKHKKQSSCCHKMMIYTNNQGPVEWAYFIKTYFEQLVDFPLFDQIVAAFKVNGKRVEICRTTHDKTHRDFIKCTKLPIHAEICFLDDALHADMIHDNIYYINLKPYYHDVSFDDMLDIFKKSDIDARGYILDDEEEASFIGRPGVLAEEASFIGRLTTFDKIMHTEFKRFKYTCLEKSQAEYEIDVILGKQIMTHLHDFFNKSHKSKTRKRSIAATAARRRKTRRK